MLLCDGFLCVGEKVVEGLSDVASTGLIAREDIRKTVPGANGGSLRDLWRHHPPLKKGKRLKKQTLSSIVKQKQQCIYA